MTANQGVHLSIELNSSVQEILGKHLLTCYPHEACGILLGAAAAGGMRIDNYLPMRNVAPDPLHAFIPDPAEWVKALYMNPPPIGLFHSHPSSAPWPSTSDLNGLPSLPGSFQVYLIGSPGIPDSSPPVFNGFYISRKSNAKGKIECSLQQATLYALLK